MTEIIKTPEGKIHTVTIESIIDLHNLLSQNTHLLEHMDPVEPKGIKNKGMLESAVNRQFTGFGDFYKYPDCFSNCSTLVYGIIKNHSFHNGNKRAGLLALIKHLYINGYVLSPKLSSNELYEFLIAIADNKLQSFSYKYRKKYNFIRSKEEKRSNPKWDNDTEIRFMGFWIKRNSSKKRTTLKGNVKISDLKKFLENKGITLEQKGSIIEVYISKESRFWGFSIKYKKVDLRKYKIGSNRSAINRAILRAIRKDFNLTKADGIDNTFFYNEDSFLDYEIRTYKELIYRLSKT